MATYVIGDLQGCYQEFQLLLGEVGYQPGKDDVWLVGDVVNRGADSLGCLRWAEKNAAAVVLGNHDLHLLAVAADIRKPRDGDTLSDILSAPDRDKLLSWLRRQPLMHHDRQLGVTMVHAGLPPQWTIRQAEDHAKEAQQELGGADHRRLLRDMYRKRPVAWSEHMGDVERQCYTVTACTRMRYCTADGAMDLFEKCTPGEQPTSLIPWFMLPERQNKGSHIVFGHWSTLTSAKDLDFAKWNVTPVDYGCVWGGSMVAVRLEDGSAHSVRSQAQLSSGRQE